MEAKNKEVYLGILIGRGKKKKQVACQKFTDECFKQEVTYMTSFEKDCNVAALSNYNRVEPNSPANSASWLFQLMILIDPKNMTFHHQVHLSSTKKVVMPVTQ